MMPKANTFSNQCQDEQCLLDLLVAVNYKEFNITFATFPHSLIRMFSVDIFATKYAHLLTQVISVLHDYPSFHDTSTLSIPLQNIHLGNF